MLTQCSPPHRRATAQAHRIQTSRLCYRQPQLAAISVTVIWFVLQECVAFSAPLSAQLNLPPSNLSLLSSTSLLVCLCRRSTALLSVIVFHGF